MKLHCFPIEPDSVSASMSIFVRRELDRLTCRDLTEPLIRSHSEDDGEKGNTNRTVHSGPFYRRLNRKVWTGIIRCKIIGVIAILKAAVVVLFAALFASAQGTGASKSQREDPPRFEDYPVMEDFKGPPAAPVILMPEERKFQTKIREGVTKGYGVEGPDGKERPGPNFAGHYYLVTWGCGSPCLMAAIVDGRTGRVHPPPFHHGPGNSFFQVSWAFPSMPPMDYRLNSRLLIANICETTTEDRSGGQISYQSHRCGPHYFVMGEVGLTLIHRVLE